MRYFTFTFILSLKCVHILNLQNKRIGIQIYKYDDYILSDRQSLVTNSYHIKKYSSRYCRKITLWCLGKRIDQSKFRGKDNI